MVVEKVEIIIFKCEGGGGNGIFIARRIDVQKSSKSGNDEIMMKCNHDDYGLDEKTGTCDTTLQNYLVIDTRNDCGTP